MKGVKPDEYIREPFMWGSKAAGMQTSWEQAKYSTGQTVQPLSEQKKDPRSLFNLYKDLISFRNGSEVLTFGDIEKTTFSIVEVISFIRKKEDEALLVLHNISDVEVTLQLVDEIKEFGTVVYDSNKSASLNEGELRLPAYSTVILK
jgi:glycosidase